MADFNDFADSDYGTFPTNGVDHDHEDNIFATEQAQVYDSSLPTPAYEAFDAPAATPAYEAPISSVPDEEDPRMIWYRQNAEVLARKDQEEREAKQELLSKAQAHLSKIYEARKVSLEAKRSKNREDEKEQSGSLPTGTTPWERVHSVINFGFDAHAQDVCRYKNILMTCKTNNVPVNVKGLEKQEEVATAELV